MSKTVSAKDTLGNSFWGGDKKYFLQLFAKDFVDTYTVQMRVAGIRARGTDF